MCHSPSGTMCEGHKPVASNVTDFMREEIAKVPRMGYDAYGVSHMTRPYYHV